MSTTKSIVRQLIIEEIKRDPLFKKSMINEGMFNDLFKKVMQTVQKESGDIESIFKAAASKAKPIEDVLKKIIKKVASTASTKSESVSNARVDYLLNNLNEGPEQLNEVALLTLVAMAKIGAIKWGFSMGVVKMLSWVRSISQWAIKKMGKIDSIDYNDLTDDKLRKSTSKTDAEYEDKEHHSHHTLEELADEGSGVVKFFARWKRIEHCVEKYMDAPFKGLAYFLVLIIGADPAAEGKETVEAMTKWIRTFFLLTLLFSALTHLWHAASHHGGWSEILSSIKHVLIESEEATAIFETEATVATEGLVTSAAVWFKRKTDDMAKILEISKSKLKEDSMKVADNIKNQGPQVATESINRIHQSALLKLESKNVNQRRIRKVLPKSRPSRK